MSATATTNGAKKPKVLPKVDFLNEKIEVREGGIHGYCWFARDKINKGEVLWRSRKMDMQFHLLVKISEYRSWDEKRQAKYDSLAYQVDDDTFLGYHPDMPVVYEEIMDYYVNHSCDGNGWYEGDDLLVALRDIKPGEEITYDYALTENRSDWVLAGGNRCLCGSALCRNRVTGNDWKRKDLQDKYGKHFMSHILQSIERDKKAQKDSSASSPSMSSDKTSSAKK